MKHTLKISLIIILAFLLSQIIGLGIIVKYIDVQKTAETGQIEVRPLPYDIPRPEAQGGGSAVTSIASAILVGTILAFIIIKFGKVIIWKIWFFCAMFFCLMFAFKAFIPSTYAAVLALILSALKIFRPNIYVHNLTELFVYGGLAAMIVPLFNNPATNIFWAFALLLLISIYDMIAVWKSKHMIKMAKFQANAKLFAGMLIPYKMPQLIKSKIKHKLEKTKVKMAILGGGDVGFPLFFSGILMQNLALNYLNSGAENFMLSAYFDASIVSLFSTAALAVLLFKGKKGKFYPAMPFLSLGCLAGYLFLMLIRVV